MAANASLPVKRQEHPDPRTLFVRSRLEKLAGEQRLRALEPIPEGLLHLCSNDYLGLSKDPRVIEGARAAAAVYGAGTGSSRLIAGELRIFRDLEESLAEFFGTESALVFPSGYQANLGLLGALPGRSGRISSDALNHASIIDGCRLSRARVEIFAHNDLADLELRLQTPPAGPQVVVTEGLFSMDGDLAPIEGLARLARARGALLLVDDAHALGVLGDEGRGISRVGREDGADVLVGTFGKALGAGGAFVAGPALVRELLVNEARTFIFTTGLVPAAAGAALRALEVLRRDPEPRARLQARVTQMRSGLQQLGFDLGPSVAHIIPLVVGTEARALEFARRLLERGVYVRAIRPPTVPEGTCRLRVTLSASHTAEQLEQALEAFGHIGRELGLI